MIEPVAALVRVLMWRDFGRVDPELRSDYEPEARQLAEAIEDHGLVLVTRKWLDAQEGRDGA